MSIPSSIKSLVSFTNIKVELFSLDKIENIHFFKHSKASNIPKLFEHQSWI